MPELLITIGYIVIFAIIAGLLSAKFKQPSVIGLLLIGSIVGPNALGIIKDIGLIHGAADLGAILLLFLIGIEFSISRLFASGLRALIITIVKIAFVFFFGYETALLLGFSDVIGLYMGVMLSISSTAIFIKIVEDKKLARNEEISLLISILILEDIFAIFALTFFSTLSATTQITVGVLLKKFAIAMIIISLSYFILLRVFKIILQWLIKNTTEDTFAFIAIGTCIGFSLLAALVKLSPSIGAFLAGSLVAAFPEAKKFQETLHPLSLTFVALFFLSLGMLIDFMAVLKNFFLIMVILIINLVSKFIIIGGGTYFISRFNTRQAIFSGLVFTSVGEFSLLIAKESSSLAPNIDLISITATVIFFSAIIMSILINYTSDIEELILGRLSYRIKCKLKDIAEKIARIPAAFEYGGELHAKFSGKTRKLVFDFFIIMAELGIIFIIWELFKHYILVLIKNKILQIILITGVIILVLYPLSLFLRNLKALLDLLVNSFVEVEFYRQIDTKLTKRIGNYFIIGSVLILSGFLLPIIFSLIKLPKIFNAISFIVIGFGILFIWGGIRKVRKRLGVAVWNIKRMWK